MELPEKRSEVVATPAEVEKPRTLQKRQQQIDTSVEGMLARAVDSGMPIDTLERLIALRDKMKAEKAQEAFHDAMARFQGECPTIQKTKEVKSQSGAVLYSYAPIDTIVAQVKEFLSKNGLSYQIKIDILDGAVKATCVVHHQSGHTESSEMQVPVGGGTQLMSESQKTAAATTFAKRYAFCNAFGIMTGDEDSEKALQETELKTAALGEYEEKLKGATSVENLTEIWANLPAIAKKELQGVASEVKKALNDHKDV